MQLICRVCCTRIHAFGVSYQTRVVTAKWDTMKKEINRVLDFYRILATVSENMIIRSISENTYRDMLKLRDIIDTWTVIEKYNIKGWKQERGIIYVPKKEFDRVYNQIPNKSYLRNLLYGNWK